MPPPQPRRASLGLLTVLYLTLPLVIFFTGWLKPGYAILSVGSVLYAAWRFIQAWPAEGEPFKRGEVGWLAAFGFGLAAFMGAGAFAPQESDWIKHNAVLFDCVNLPWPVVLADGSAHWSLVYYLAYYLPAALVGKAAGYAAAQVALWVWTSLGITLVCAWFARLTRLPAALAAVAFFAFSGLTFAANLLVQVLGLSSTHGPLLFYPNETWARIWQFQSHWWLLEMAPGQSLAAWLSASLFLASPPPLRPAGFAFLFVCVLLWSPFAAVGLLLAAFFLFYQKGLAWPLKCWQLFPALLLPLGLLLAFYAAKTSPDVNARFPKIAICWFTQFRDAPGLIPSVCLLVLCAVFEFGIFLWFVRARFPKGTEERRLADATGWALAALLPVVAGYYSDLSMRAAAVPMFCLAVLMARALATPGLAPRLRRWFWLAILIGALTPLTEFAHQAYHLLLRKYDPRLVPRQVSAVVHMRDGGFDIFGAQYVGSTNSFFMRHLAR